MPRSPRKVPGDSAWCHTLISRPPVAGEHPEQLPHIPRIRFAVVGLGHIAQVAVLPAFAKVAQSCELVALVSDDPVKLGELSRTYHVEHTYAYDQFDACLASGIDAVYIALPNHLHLAYTLRAAQAGVHVLCEKPMALTEEQCEEMITEATAAGIKLMIAYRLHFERANLKAVALANAKVLGELRFFASTFSMQVKPGDIRVQAALGGGPLYDIGIYCINAARYLFRSEPFEVMAMSCRSTDERFVEVDEMTAVMMRFPGERLATFTASFGAADTAAYDLVGTHGALRVDPAYEYADALHHRLTVNGKRKEMTFPVHDQFAAELAYFAQCIVDDVKPEPSGEEGMADVRIIRAILQSAQLQRPVTLSGESLGVERPQPEQGIDQPASDKTPPLVHVAPPRRNQ